MRHILTCVGVCLLIPIAAQAQEGEVRYGPPPSWVVPMQPRAPAAGRQEGALYFTYSDVQVRADGAGTEQYAPIA